MRSQLGWMWILYVCGEKITELTPSSGTEPSPLILSLVTINQTPQTATSLAESPWPENRAEALRRDDCILNSWLDVSGIQLVTKWMTLVMQTNLKLLNRPSQWHDTRKWNRGSSMGFSVVSAKSRKVKWWENRIVTRCRTGMNLHLQYLGKSSFQTITKNKHILSIFQFRYSIFKHILYNTCFNVPF